MRLTGIGEFREEAGDKTFPLSREAPPRKKNAAAPDEIRRRGHFGDAYGWITGLVWDRRHGRTLVYALNGMPEKDARRPGTPA